jgi:hypothetical protein
LGTACSTTAWEPHGSDEVASPEHLERAILDFGADFTRPIAVPARLDLLPMLFANSSSSVLGEVLNTMLCCPWFMVQLYMDARVYL